MVYNAADNLPAVAMIFKKINSSGSMQLSHSLVREGGSTGKGSQPTTDFLHPLLPPSSALLPLLCRSTAFAAAVIRRENAASK